MFSQLKQAFTPSRDVTSALLDGYSPYLHSIRLDFPTNSIEFHLLDRIEQPSSIRVLRFDRLIDLQITSHEPNDTDPNFIDSIIGVQRGANEFHIHTDRFAITFHCDSFHDHILSV